MEIADTIKKDGRYKFVIDRGLVVWDGEWVDIRKDCNIIGAYLVDKEEYERLDE